MLEQPPRLAFPVVAIGASAGGLEAFFEFFAELPADPGMAFVVIQHLPPDRESMLVEILGKHTAMPVAEVTSGQPLQADHVYVIRPGRTLTIRDGRLHLGQELERPGHGHPIDDFFRSLAEEQRERAICIVMSGMGSNGAAGAQAVKAVGGVCIAQDPDSAKFASMPRHLIDAGLADFVLPPRDMPETLRRYASHPYAQGRIAPEDLLRRAGQQFQEILTLLRTRLRRDFSGYKNATVLRRIERRMGLAQIRELGDYVKLLRGSPTEVTALADDLLIHVTGFFRDPEAWEALREQVIVPLVAESEPDGQVRCWVTACSTGEESYSLAILLHEAAQAAGKHLDIKIFATDAVDRLLGHARQGLYPAGIEAEVTPARLERFFDKDAAMYRVKKELRQCVVFAPQNVLHDPPFSRLDLCTCRNMLIYLEPEMQHRVLTLLHFSLRDGGVLFLGTSETASAVDGGFAPIDKRWRIYRRTGASRSASLTFPTLAALTAAVDREQRDGKTLNRTAVAQISNKLLLERYTPAAVTVDHQQHIVYFHGDTDPFLAQPRGEPTRDLMLMARENVRGAIRAALQEALAKNHAATVRDGLIETRSGPHRVEVTVAPLDRPAQGHHLISFVLLAEPPSPAPASPDAAGDTSQQSLLHELERMRDELQGTVEELQTSNEELKASNEEVTSVNEELQSTNEELETGKEELQSLNEELTTVNAQLQTKMHELESTTNDLSSLLASTDIGVLFLDAEFRIRRFTPAIRDLMDLLPADVGRPLSDMARKFDDPSLLADARAVLDKLVPITKSVRAASGRCYERRVLPYRTLGNHIEGVVITFVDVTEQRQAEERRRTAAERLQRIVHSETVGVAVFDAGGRITEGNEGFLRLAGVDATALQRGELRWERLAAAEWREPVRQALADWKAGGRIAPQEHEYVRPDGSRWWGLVTGSALGRDEGVLYFVDTTEHKRAVRERDRYFVIADALLGTISSADRRWSSVNPAFERVLGRTASAMLSTTFRDLVHADDLEPVQAALANLASSDAARSFECRMRCGDGSFRNIAWTATPFPGEAITYCVGVDLTEQRELAAAQAQVVDRETAARQAMGNALRIMDEFVATVSHELRTPLSSILLWTRMLKRQDLTAEQQREGISVIERGAEAQKQLIDDLLDTSRITSGKLRLDLRPTDLRTLIGDAITTMLPAAAAKGLQVEQQIATDLGSALVDPDRLRQVVWNLVSNAVKFTPKGGRIAVAARRANDTIEIAVTDNGRGIDLGFLPHIFDHFTQQDFAGTKRQGGLGLGLSISRQLMELHGGTIRATSDGPGRGAQFLATLPGKQVEALAPAGYDGGSSVHGIRIVLVEDDADSRVPLASLLAGAGAVVRAFDCVESALAVMARERPDVLVTDINLHGEDGYSLLRAVRERERALPGPPLPAIAVTAYARETDRRAALDAGFQRHFGKPVDLPQLLVAIRELVVKQ